jgi:hypothetical protein
MKNHIGVCPKLVPSEKKEGLTGWVFLLLILINSEAVMISLEFFCGYPF